MPEHPMCESPTCMKKNPAIIEVEGDIDDGLGGRKHVTMKLCAECAGPLLRVGQPISVEAKCPPP